MKVLYFGLNQPTSTAGRTMTHCPLIRVERRDSSEVDNLPNMVAGCTHILFTSQTAVRFFFSIVPRLGNHHSVLSIGAATTRLLSRIGISVSQTCTQECSEGVSALLEHMPRDNMHLLWPHSALSRSLIKQQLERLGIVHTACILYDTYPVRPEPLPDLRCYDELVFTSPSTVSAFFSVFDAIPSGLTITCIGPITKKALLEFLPSDRITFVRD